MNDSNDPFEQHLASFRPAKAPDALRQVVLTPKRRFSPFVLVYTSALAAAWIAIAALRLATPTPDTTAPHQSIANLRPGSHAIFLTSCQIDQFFNESP